MTIVETTPEQLAQLKSLRPGTPIFIEINGVRKEAKFGVIPPNSFGRFQARIKGQIAWLEGHQFAGIQEDALSPAKVDNSQETATQAGFIKLAPFAKMVIEKASELAQTDSRVQVSELAEALNLGLLNVSGSLATLARLGLIVQTGLKGARYLELTPAGQQYILDSEQGAEVKPIKKKGAELELTDDVLAALAKISGNVGACVADISTANTLTQIAEIRPELLVKTVATVDGAYFNAELTQDGRDFITSFSPETFGRFRNFEILAVPVVVSNPIGSKKRGPKKGRKLADIADKNIADSIKKVRPVRLRVDGQKGIGGRPAKGNQSLREVVLNAIKSHEGTNELSHKQLVTDLMLATKQDSRLSIQNAIFKLGRSGFLETDQATGRVLTPIKLTGIGEKGYVVNAKGAVKKRAQELISAGKTDQEIARELNADDTYIRYIRSGKKAKPAAATE